MTNYLKSSSAFVRILPPILLLAFLLVPSSGWSAKSSEEFNVEGGSIKKENLFNLFFGGAPLMPTQHGTVIVEAYHDKNDNKLRDAGEESLDQAIICIVEEIVYQIPAFIPGLDNGMNYTFLFEGEGFQPSIKQKNVFIKKRGQIIRIDVPCRPDLRQEVHAQLGN
ncbi:hypothetical protein A7E78_02255 [Syntrophotalea acetylenivorans]|uniref:Uncharacterized protein n=1 Tax=Syntrophotalea acetylenivorans TaxID=1842532 RepID=A0A1L3GLK4_9BACT|nr:hypothetical protein [Syntrophotalea acetylenivorans]APG26780.1 hypothetical protein A7E78_02255 [Syntrophotalea acetylenivorans]